MSSTRRQKSRITASPPRRQTMAAPALAEIVTLQLPIRISRIPLRMIRTSLEIQARTDKGNTTQNNQNQSGNTTQNNQNQSGNLTQNNGQNSQTTDSGKDSQTPSAAPSGDTKTTDTKAAPKTGDESPIGLWILMMLLAVSGVGYWVYEKRKSVR